ncbi:unnamed protein product [Prorocentrum cordatum]|uniref:Uncharacterized protein n=1 Tax=Prorocentrum cordatum TaxID=2364126 RepID=A0ABN9XXN3_9DINO|nr:unnamed protein product [Polarella glacialis]
MASSSSSLPDLRASASSRPRMVRDLSLKGTAGHAQRRAAPVQTFNRAERWPRPGHDDLTPRKLAGPEVASARTGPAFTIGKSKVRELRDADEGQPRKLAEPHDSSVVLHKMSRAPAFSIGKGGREAGFAWTGSDYSRSGGNQSIDKAGLMKYKQVLAPLLRAAPSGFPTQGSLRAVFVVADARYGVLGTNEKGRFNASNTATAIFRKMCKDVYNLCKVHVPPELQELADLITPQPPKKDGRAKQSEPPTSQPATPPLASEPVFATFDSEPEVENLIPESDSDADSVEFVSCKCQCPKCVGPLIIPGAKKGEQKKDTTGGDADEAGSVQKCRRIWHKTDMVKVATRTSAPVNAAAVGKESTAPAATVDGCAAECTKPSRKAPKKAQKAPQEALDQPIVFPIEIVSRATGSKESCILQNTSKFRFVVSVKEKNSTNYLAIVNTIAEKIRASEVTTANEAMQLALEMSNEFLTIWGWSLSVETGTA